MIESELKKIFNEFYIVQNFREMSWLVEKVEKIISENSALGKPSTIIEVGVESCGTMKVWEQLLKKCNDGNKNNWDGWDGWSIEDNLLIGIDYSPNVVWDISKSDIDVRMVIGNSHDDSTLEEVKKILFDGRLFNGDMLKSVDFVYIDAEHTSEAAMMDFEMYGGLVRKGGAVGFHDYNDVKGFLNTLDQDKLEVYFGQPPFDNEGMQATVGTAFYHV